MCAFSCLSAASSRTETEHRIIQHTQKTAGGGSKSSSRSALLVAKEGGKVVGCVGLETRVIREGQVTKQGSLKGEVCTSGLRCVV